MLSRIKFEIESLVEEILDQLPAEVWSSTTTTFLDPAMGGGQFVRAIERRLREAGHSDKNIFGRVHGCESTVLHVNFAVNKHSLVGNYGVCDFLEKDFGDMKFDVVVGNPPYQDSTRSKNVKPGAGKGNLYPKFVDKAWRVVNDNGYVAIVLPTSYFSTTQWNQYASKNEFTLKRQVNVINTGVEKHFNVGTAICYFVAKNCESSTEPTINGSTFEISKYKFIPNYSNKIGISILNKLTKGPNKFSFVRDRIPAGNNVVFMSLQGGKVTNTGIMKFHDELRGKTGGIIYHSCKSEKNFKNLMNSKVFRFFIKNTKINNTVYPGLMNGMSMPPKEKMTDAELYAHFNLSQEEIDYIEANVK